MNPEEEEKEIVVQLVNKDFDFELIRHDWEDMHKSLTVFIKTLLDKDFERLLQGLYRIDVDEEKVKEILNIRSPEFIAADLAHLIIERQKQKAVTRMRYR